MQRWKSGHKQIGLDEGKKKKKKERQREKGARSWEDKEVITFTRPSRRGSDDGEAEG